MAPGPSDAAIQAARDGNLRRLKEMASGVDLRGVRGSKGRTLLHLAAAKGRLKVCKFLVEGSGLHVDSTSVEGETPILLAAGAEGCDILPVLRYLLDRGGDPAMPDAGGSTPLHNAAEYGNCKAVRLLLSKGVPVDPLGHRGTPLHLAAGYGHGQAVKILLEHGADPNRVVNHVHSPLMAACYAHSLECTKLLVEDGKFPIMLAAAHEHRELVEILFPRTKPIPSMLDWSVDGIIKAMKYPHVEPRELVEENIADAKSQGKEAFASTFMTLLEKKKENLRY
ncbi:tankyrase-1-like [Panicum miliaceum]|uniref:Tankyrase-1-like n=1 Tax=Panicum miliaceum TaxID=4540 RepID=A0A3L6SWF9_PANMI|nr:tankyrase-1-like [Panicum miliaceum]